jgi:hypothetical protein
MPITVKKNRNNSIKTDKSTSNHKERPPHPSRITLIKITTSARAITPKLAKNLLFLKSLATIITFISSTQLRIFSSWIPNNPEKRAQTLQIKVVSDIQSTKSPRTLVVI